MILDAIGAPLPPFYALLEELADRVPATEGPWMLGPDGSELDEQNLPAATRKLFDDYRLVQYDLSVGRRYALRSMFYNASSSGTTRASAATR